jgi:hypothetical protein
MLLRRLCSPLLWAAPRCLRVSRVSRSHLHFDTAASSWIETRARDTECRHGREKKKNSLR